MTVADEEPTLPSLAAWMDGAPTEHPLHRPDIPSEFLSVWDEVLRPIEATQPLRIARKKEAFRKIRTFPQCMEQRAELLAASMLARAGIKFEFASVHPDLVLTGASCGIEIGTRAIDDPRSLLEEIEGRTLGLGDRKISLMFDGRPLHFGATRLIEVANEVVALAATGPGELRFGDLGLTVAIENVRSEGVEVSMNTQRLGSELKDHMAEVEREVDNKSIEKRRQAGAMPTVLLLDISRVGDSFIRSPDVWAQVLNTKLKGEPHAGLGVMVTSLDESLPRQLAVVLADEVPNAMKEAFDELADVLGLKHTKLD